MAKPDKPTDLSKRSWKNTFKRTVKEFKEDDLTDWAAALTYYSVLSIFPALIVLVSLLGLIGESATQPLLDNLGAVTPGPAREIFTNAVVGIQSGKGASGVALAVGIAGALWTASGYIGAFIRASNAIYEKEEGRPFWKLRPLQLLLTMALILLLSVVSLALIVTGPLAEAVGNVVGAGDATVTAWEIGKWPVLLAIVMVMFAVLYYAAPNVKQPKFRWVSVGGVIGVVIWILASAAFAFYVANFGSYNKTYGTLGGVISFLVWLWITNIAVLFGAEFDAELERERELAHGLPAEEEIQLPPRQAATE